MNDDRDTISELLKPRADISQFTRTRTHPQDTVSPADDDYVAFGHGRVGLRPRMMLGFRKCNGQVDVFPYSLLTAIHSDDVDTGFTLTFGPRIVRVEGHKLTQLFRYVCEHRAVEIAESDRTTVMQTDDNAIV
ncbi:MAG: hypothetical protein KDA91_24960, partial [Planctomycetaceae bacterium]|nr:hypothetical protein [Planctomycetaceae bacterium]